MIKREFEKLALFIDHLPEKELPLGSKSLIISKLNQAYSVLNESFQNNDNFISNNSIINDHEKKHHIFGAHINHCGKCLNHFALKEENNRENAEIRCDLCFKTDTFLVFYLECIGCYSKICTFCSSNLMSNRNLPCLKCSEEMKEKTAIIGGKWIFCDICQNNLGSYLGCENCDWHCCTNCHNILIIKIFQITSKKKFKDFEKLMIEKKIDDLMQQERVQDMTNSKKKIDQYLNDIFNIIKTSSNYLKYDIPTIKSFLKAHGEISNSNGNSEMDIASERSLGNIQTITSKSNHLDNLHHNLQKNQSISWEKAQALEGFFPDKSLTVATPNNTIKLDSITQKNTLLQNPIPFKHIETKDYNDNNNFNETQQHHSYKHSSSLWDNTIQGHESKKMDQTISSTAVFDKTIASTNENHSFFNTQQQYPQNKNIDQTISSTALFDRTIASTKLDNSFNRFNINKDQNNNLDKTIASATFEKTIGSSMGNSRFDDLNSLTLLNSKKDPNATLNTSSIGEGYHQRYSSYDPKNGGFVFSSPINKVSFSSNSFVKKPQNNDIDNDNFKEKRTVDSVGFSVFKDQQDNSFLSSNNFSNNKNNNQTNGHSSFNNDQQGNNINNQTYSYGGFNNVLSGIAGNISGFQNEFVPQTKQEISRSLLEFNEVNPNSKVSLVNLLYDFENEFEQLCRAHTFEEINKATLQFFQKITTQNLDKIYDPSKFDDSLYVFKDFTATTLELIGSGGYGTVHNFEMKEKNVKSNSVGKMFRIPQSSKNEFYFNFSSFLKEWRILRSFEHENIIKIMGVFYRKNFTQDDIQMVGLFLEKMDINLDDYLNEMRRTLNLAEKLVLAINISQGLKYIHEVHHRVHRDMKPGNILLDHKGKNIKIIDFGTVSEDILQKKYIMDDAFTVTYAPPEFIRYYYLNEKVELNFGSDIWSLGVILFDIFSLKSQSFGLPWLQILTDFERKSIDFAVLRERLEKEGFLLEKDSEKLKEFIKNQLNTYVNQSGMRNLMEKCFLMKSSERMKIGEVVEQLMKFLKEAETMEKKEVVKKAQIPIQKTEMELELEKEDKKKKELFHRAVKRKDKF